MKTKSNKKQSILLIVFLVAILALAAIFFTACASEQEAFEKYGKENAFWKDDDGNLVFLHNTDTVNFYLDPSLSSDWLTAAKYAIAKANAITDALTITGDGTEPKEGYVSFTISQMTWPDTTEAALGMHAVTTFIPDCYVNSAQIKIYSYSTFWMNDSVRKEVMMHEIGHVMGLWHPNALVYEESLMDPVTSMVWGDSDYGRFDKANIKWMYEEYKPNR